MSFHYLKLSTSHVPFKRPIRYEPTQSLGNALEN